ncbi:hypothetical protein [Spiroplasma sp. DGKH1]
MGNCNNQCTGCNCSCNLSGAQHANGTKCSECTKCKPNDDHSRK